MIEGALIPSPPFLGGIVLGVGDDRVPAAAGDEACWQREAGKEEERALARTLHRAARTKVAAEWAGLPG